MEMLFTIVCYWTLLLVCLMIFCSLSVSKRGDDE